MDSPIAIAKWFVPQIPSLAYQSASHTLGWSTTSSKWDLRTELTISVLRHLMSGKGRKTPGVTKAQAITLKDPGIKGKIWVAKDTFHRPQEPDIEDAVLQAVEDMKPGEINLLRPGLSDVDVEWTGYRPRAGNSEALPNISEAEKYQRLLAEPTRTSDLTILYFHGGAYYLCDPVTHRPICSKLAQESGGTLCSVRYRLSPQTAFPGQLLDAFLAYLSLLYPPEGALHAAIPAKNIVFAGDSAGGNLSLALLQLLLQLHRAAPNPTTTPPQVRFHGRTVAVPLPAGASANSGWFDISRGMPSVARNAHYDYLPPLRANESVSRYPADSAWPSDPPRGDLFCDLSLLDHPLVSPLLAADWAAAPPLWLCTGEEMLADEDCVLAARAASQGVAVCFEQYEAMPHVFALMLMHLPTAQRCVRSWAAWARKCVEAPAGLRASGTWIEAKSGRESSIDVENVGAVTYEDAHELVAKAKERRLLGYEKEGKLMPKPTL